MKIERKDLKDLEIQFTLTADKEEIDQAKTDALTELGKEVNVPGFRKGKAPANEIKKRVGELRILQEALDLLIEKGYKQVISENEDLYPIAQPEINIDDDESFIAEEATLNFTIKVTNRPEINLPDYKNLNVPYEKASVSDEDVENAVKELFERWQEGTKMQAEQANKIDTATSLTEAEQKAADTKDAQQENLEAISKDAPDDEWAQMLGAQNLEDLNMRLRANLALEKTYEAGNKFTQDLVNKLYEQTKIKLPNNLITSDIEHRKKHKEEDLEKIGLDLEGFAKQQKMTVEELEKQWREEVEKEYTLEFALDAIGKEENVSVTDEEVQAEIKASQSADTLKLFQDEARKERLRHLMRRDKVIGKLVEYNFPTVDETKPKKDTKAKEEKKKKPAKKTTSTTKKKAK